MQPARWGHQGWYRLPGPPLRWSRVQLMDICHNPTTADPSHSQSCNEICMKQECLAVVDPVLINDSIHCRLMWNTFIIHYLFMQSILCILIPPPALLHWNEAKLKLYLKFKVVPLPWASSCPLTAMHTALLESVLFFFTLPCPPSISWSNHTSKHICDTKSCQSSSSF